MAPPARERERGRKLLTTVTTVTVSARDPPDPKKDGAWKILVVKEQWIGLYMRALDA